MRTRYLRRKKIIKAIKGITLFTLIVVVVGLLLTNTLIRMEKDAKECDKAKGYTCSYYEVRNFN